MFQWLLLFFILAHSVVSQSFNVIRLAGDGTAGKTDGIGTNARFHQPSGLAVTSDGTIFVADVENHQIRKISSSGIVSTFVGAGVPGKSDGYGTMANFQQPMDIVISLDEQHLFVTDSGNNRIRKVTMDGHVSKLGNSKNNEVEINSPNSIVLDQNGQNIYVTSSSDNSIYKISLIDGTITPLAGSLEFGWTDGKGSFAKFNNPTELAMDAAGNLYVSDMGNNFIRKISRDGQVSTLTVSGSFQVLSNSNEAVIVYAPGGLGFNSAGDLFIVEQGNFRVQRVDMKKNSIAVVMGGIISGLVDGQGTQAKFKCPYGLAVDTHDNIYISEDLQPVIRKVIVCPQDSFFHVRNNSCLTCAAGYELNTDAVSCDLCPVKYFKGSIGSQKCTKCQDNTESRFNRHGCVESSPSGGYCPENALCNSGDGNFVCNPGFELNLEKTLCIECSPDYVKGTFDNSSCTKCPLGHESDSAHFQCIQCPPGKFKSRLDLSQCINCPQGAVCTSTNITCVSGYTPDKETVFKCVPNTRPIDSTGFAAEISKIYVIVVLLTVLLVIALILYMSYRKLKSYRARLLAGSINTVFLDKEGSDSFTSSKISSFTNATTTTKTKSTSTGQTSSISWSNQTTVEALAGLCIPAFINFKLSADFIIDKGAVYASGGAGNIYLGTAIHPDLTQHGSKIIVKELKHTGTKDKWAFFQEISLIYMFRENKKIVKLLGYSEQPHLILLKYYELGNLESWLYSKETVKTKQILFRFIKNIADTMAYLEVKGVAHCDLKANNILIDRDPDTGQLFCVLADFGISCLLNDDALNVNGFEVMQINGFSLFYASPESIVNLRQKLSNGTKYPNYPYSYSPIPSDIYSLAVIIFAILTREKMS